jgi:S-methylmethionine-dependent homocysteine/selenocysteine methylase
MMPKYRENLPQLSSPKLFLTDGGLETDLIFHEGFDLPLFAAFPLLDSERGVDALRRYYLRFAQVAKDAGAGFILEAATWRASRDWASQLGYTTASLADVNRRAIDLLCELREEIGEDPGPVVISASIGPQGDAYNPDQLLTPSQAESYHREQIEVLAATEADLVTAMTLTYAAEAIGIVRAAQAAGVPSVISFTVETNGVLPDGSSLAAAIAAVDGATESGPAYYGVNCAHPTHFESVLRADEVSMQRVRMLRGNASRMSHEELDNAADLDEGNPEQFGKEYAELRGSVPQINVFGGCCGTDVRHVQAVARLIL